MEKQKKQLLLLAGILIVALAAFLIVSKLPDEEETEETVKYQVTDIDENTVTKLVYTNENETITLSKSDDQWQYQEDKTLDIDEDTVESMIGKIAFYESENKLENVEDISLYGLDEPILTVLISDEDTSFTMLVGDYNETTYTYYMCLENDTTTVYTIKSADISVFRNNTLEDLIAEEETTEAETTDEETVEEEMTKEDAGTEEISIEEMTDEQVTETQTESAE